VRWWGIHNNDPDIDFVDEGFVALGWDKIAFDLTTLGNDRDAIKSAANDAYPHKGTRTFAAWAGIFVRFVYEAENDDVIVHPDKRDKSLNFGRIAGPYTFHPTAKTRRHRRRVNWTNTGVPRDAFSQEALWEVGNTMTFFELRKHVRELSQFA
jgi:restriction system protein